MAEKGGRPKRVDLTPQAVECSILIMHYKIGIPTTWNSMSGNVEVRLIRNLSWPLLNHLSAIYTRLDWPITTSIPQISQSTLGVYQFSRNSTPVAQWGKCLLIVGGLRAG